MIGRSKNRIKLYDIDKKLISNRWHGQILGKKNKTILDVHMNQNRTWDLILISDKTNVRAK